MSDSSEYIRLGDGGNNSRWMIWQYGLTLLEKILIILTIVFAITIFSLSIELSNCKNREISATTVAQRPATRALLKANSIPTTKVPIYKKQKSEVEGARKFAINTVSRQKILIKVPNSTTEGTSPSLEKSEDSGLETEAEPKFETEKETIAEPKEETEATTKTPVASPEESEITTGTPEETETTIEESTLSPTETETLTESETTTESPETLPEDATEEESLKANIDYPLL